MREGGRTHCTLDSLDCPSGGRRQRPDHRRRDPLTHSPHPSLLVDSPRILLGVISLVLSSSIYRSIDLASGNNNVEKPPKLRLMEW